MNAVALVLSLAAAVYLVYADALPGTPLTRHVEPELVAIAVTLSVTMAGGVPIGCYVARVFPGQRPWLDPLCRPIERLLLLRFFDWTCATLPTWTGPTRARGYVSNAAIWLAAWTIVTPRGWLPLNPDADRRHGRVAGFNTASSFVTNTNLQHYSGETGLSYVLADGHGHVPPVRSAATGWRR